MKSERGGFRMLRHEQLLQERVHDAYRRGAKLPEPARCRDCGAVYRRGRWTWGAAAEGARPVRCPACARIREGMPAGYLSLSGAYLEANRDDRTGSHLARRLGEALVKSFKGDAEYRYGREDNLLRVTWRRD